MTDESTPAARPVGRIIAIVVAVLFGIYVFCQVATGDTEKPDTGISQGEAWDACKNAVEAQLNNPGSADFALTATDITDAPGGGYSITGSLTAENDFGAEQELGYSCRVYDDGRVRANVS